ncbi:MAG: RDD family protein [Cellulomonas sp.]
MTAREYIGSWLGGAGSDDGPRSGSRLALPESGPGSLASLGRRVVALCLDWAVCLLISTAFFGGDPMATLAVFAVENVLLVATIGHTLGHRVLGIHVRRATGAGVVGLGRAALRTLLVCLVIPAVVWDGDGRGLHDRSAGTLIVRL